MEVRPSRKRLGEQEYLNKEEIKTRPMAMDQAHQPGGGRKLHLCGWEIKGVRLSSARFILGATQEHGMYGRPRQGRGLLDLPGGGHPQRGEGSGTVRERASQHGAMEPEHSSVDGQPIPRGCRGHHWCPNPRGLQPSHCLRTSCATTGLPRVLTSWQEWQRPPS